MFEVRRRKPTRIALAGATLIVAMAPAAPSWATPHMKGPVRDPRNLQLQVVRLFDRLDRTGRGVERVRAEIAQVDQRISELSRQIEAQRGLLERRAAEAYMGGRAGGIEALLGSSSLADIGDTLAFIDAVSEKDADLVHSLRLRKGEIELERARLGTLIEELRARRERLTSMADDLVEKLQRQEALRRRELQEEPQDASVDRAPVPPSPAAASPSLAPGPAAVIALIRDGFASLGSGAVATALCVAERESGFDPLAVNPATQASGLFQFLPSTWDSVSRLAGWDGASVFDARANASVAAWTVAHYGWHPWRSVAAACGA